MIGARFASRRGAVLAGVALSLAACRRQPAAPESTVQRHDASVVAAAAPWTEDTLRTRLVQAQLDILQLHHLKKQPAPAGQLVLGLCGDFPATAGPSAAEVDRLAGRDLAGAALECLVKEYWGCRLGDRIGFDDMQPDEQELVVHTRSKVQILEQTADHVVAAADMVPWSCVSPALEKDDQECHDPPYMVPYELDRGADGIWRIVTRGSCKLRPGKVVTPVFKLAAVSGDDGPQGGIGELAGGPTLLEWPSAPGASARFEAPAPVMVESFALGAPLSECVPTGARVQLDDGERIDVEATNGYVMHRFATPKRIRSLTITPLPSHDGPACVGHLVVVPAK
jgi:hypothetical protein